jgi:hypothetical protein
VCRVARSNMGDGLIAVYKRRNRTLLCSYENYVNDMTT